MKTVRLKISLALYITGIFLVISACSPQQENFDWLTGEWVRTNDTEDQTTYEFWEKKSETEFKGLGFTLRQSDTIWKENILLHKKNGSWSFEVSGMNDNKATVFLMSSIKKDRFVAENKENEFPKKIEYRLVNNHIHAIISGGGPEILFEFEKINP